MTNYFVSVSITLSLLYLAVYQQVPYLSAALYVLLFLWYAFIAFVSFTLMLLSLGTIRRDDEEGKIKDAKLLLKAGNLYLKNYWVKEILFAVFTITQFMMICFNPTYSVAISLILSVPFLVMTACTIVFKNETIKLAKSLDKDTNGSH
jgi:hypothetical protein